MKRQDRVGFTLVELLVVITIIGMLMALLLPAVQAARESGRRTTCINNQKQIGYALAQYEEANGHLPGYIEEINIGNDRTLPVSWVVTVFPYVERRDLWELWSTGTQQLALQDWLICPSNPPEQMSAGSTPLAYVVNGGLPGEPAVRYDGLFYCRAQSACSHGLPKNQWPKISFATIKDGASQTLMVSEGLWSGPWQSREERRLCFNWFEGSGDKPKINAQLGPNAANYTPSSYHGNVVIVTFADTHAKVLREDINDTTYIHLMTPNSAKAQAKVPFSLGVLDDALY